MPQRTPLPTFAAGVALLVVVAGPPRALSQSPGPDSSRPRVVVTADPELDDSNSLIRYLLYSTDFRTEGLVYASSQFHWKGDGTGKKWAVPNREYFRFGLSLCPCESWRWAPDERFIDDAVDVYERVYPNLRVHHSGYPTPAELRAKIRWGNVEFDGDISKDTPGSDLIRDLLLDDDPDPIYLLAWGGASTIARALKSIQERHERTAGWPALRARISRKAILSLSGDQDDTYAKYIRPNWPDIRSLAIGQGGVGVGYGAFVFASAENAPFFSVNWTRANVSSRGPLGAHYRVWGDGKQMVTGDRFDYFGLAGQTADELRAKGYVVWLPPRPKGEFLGEGDTFTFFNLIGNGLGAYRAETPGGWAGRVPTNPSTRRPSPSTSAQNTTTSFESFMRSLEGIGPEGPATRPPSPQPNFVPAAQHGFAARMQWSVTPRYSDANHEPVVAIRGDSRVSARPGDTLRLEATVSDPDGDAVAVRWWRWKDVDTYSGEVHLSDTMALATTLHVPEDARPGDTIQLVLEATDNGSPALTRYQRVVVTVTAASPPAGQATIFDQAPAARWIAPPGIPGDSFTVFHARRTFELNAAPARFVVHVSADNLYRLYVNGAHVASGPQRSDVGHWRHETLDLAPHLRVGRNVIAAIVWNWGAARPVAQHSHRTGFLMQGNSSVEATHVNTGSGWRLRIDSAFAPIVITSASMGNYYAAAPGDSIDGSRYPWGWERADYDDGGWLQVSAAPGPANPAPLEAFSGAGGNAIVGRAKRRATQPGEYGEMSGWQLEPRSIPAMEERLQRLGRVRRSDGVATDGAFLRGAGDLVIPPRTRASLLLDQSRTTNAYPVIETSAGRGSSIRLSYAEALVDSLGRKGHRDSISGRAVRGVRDVFLPDGGARRRFQTLFWRSFRYVQLDVATADEPLRIHDLLGIFTAYPFVERARFDSDLPWLADMWRMNWNGARIGAFDTYMDTPYWEQLQYVGDTRVQALISLYVAGDDRLMRQAIEHFDLSRIPEGLTASRYPSALTQIIPPFSLVYVAMVHDFFMHRSDDAFVRSRLAGIRGILDWYGRHVDSTGMLGPMPHWNYVDWTNPWPRGVPPGADHGHSATISLLYVYALRRAAELEDTVGLRGAGDAYRARAESVVQAVRGAWHETRGLFGDSPDTNAFSQQTNVLAILTDAAPASGQRALMHRVLSDTTLTRASYYFGFYVLEALRKAGLADRYIEQLAPWRTMLALGLTSTPENPEPTRSDTHAWAAHPNYGLLATVLGVRPSSPGFRTVQIAPALGPLQRAEGRVPHPSGDIEVRIERRGAAGVTAHVTLPPGLSGVFDWRGVRRPLREGAQSLRF